MLSSEKEPDTCRLCMDGEGNEPLIAPCKCAGGSLYVHRSCLDKWRATKQNLYTFNRCEVCHFDYWIDPIQNTLSERQRLKQYYKSIFVDGLSVILIVVALIVLTSAVVRQMDINSDHELVHGICEAMNRGRSCTSPPSTLWYGSIGTAVFFAIIGVIGTVMWIFDSCCCDTHRQPRAVNNAEDEWRYRRSGWSPDVNVWVYHSPPSSSSSSSGNCCGSGGGSNCECKGCGGSGGDKDGCMVVLIILVLVFAVIGVFYGVYYFIQWLHTRATARSEVIWNLQEVERFPVHDFRHEIHKLSQQQLNNDDSIKVSVV